MENHELVCYCDNVTKGEIIAAMEQGAKTLADIKRMTGACCSCKCAEMNPSGKCCAQDIALVMREYILSKKEEIEEIFAKTIVIQSIFCIIITTLQLLKIVPLLLKQPF